MERQADRDKSDLDHGLPHRETTICQTWWLLLIVLNFLFSSLGSSVKKRDAQWLTRLVRRAGSVDGKELCSLTSVAERRTFLSLMDNVLQHLHSTLTSQRQQTAASVLVCIWLFGCRAVSQLPCYVIQMFLFLLFYSYFSFFILISSCVSGYMSCLVNVIRATESLNIHRDQWSVRLLCLFV